MLILRVMRRKCKLKINWGTINAIKEKKKKKKRKEEYYLSETNE